MAKNYYYIDDATAHGPNTLLAIENESARFGIGTTTSIGVDKVSTGTTTGTGTYYPTFVDSNNSTIENEFLYTDAGISYNPSTNSLGIGTTDPKNKLEVYGNIGIGTNYIHKFNLQDTNSYNIGFNSTSFLVWTLQTPTGIKTTLTITGWYDNNAYIDNRNSGDIYFRSGNSQTLSSINSLVVKNGGNVGIGTTNPAFRLQVNGDIYLNSSLVSSGSSESSGSIIFSAASSTSNIDHIWNSDANVVDGVVGTQYGNFPGIYHFVNDGTYKSTGNSALRAGGFFNRDHTGTLNQKLQIEGGAYVSDNLGIGITNPGEKLQVDGNIRVGISTTSNYIAFRGTFADGVNASGEDQSSGLVKYTHTFIGERIYETGTEKSELLLFKGNDPNPGVGPDIVRVLAGEFRVDTHQGFSGTFEEVGNYSSTNALIVTSTGDLGIGITIPTSKLHVSGNVTVTGSVSKGSGSFVIDHPLNETKNLVHSFVEGPRADLIYRGIVSLIDGSATINLDEEYELIPGTWKALCRNPQVWISNIDGWTNCRGTVEDGILTIEAQTASNESVNWLVIAERKDKHMYDTEWTDDNGRPILEPVKL